MKLNACAFFDINGTKLAALCCHNHALTFSKIANGVLNNKGSKEAFNGSSSEACINKCGNMNRENVVPNNNR